MRYLAGLKTGAASKYDEFVFRDLKKYHSMEQGHFQVTTPHFFRGRRCCCWMYPDTDGESSGVEPHCLTKQTPPAALLPAWRADRNSNFDCRGAFAPAFSDDREGLRDQSSDAPTSAFKIIPTRLSRENSRFATAL
jgi:hypothetical protein